MTNEEIITIINEIRHTLDEVSFKLYFAPSDAKTVTGFNDLDAQIATMKTAVEAITTP
jgi:hypothetical protein